MLRASVIPLLSALLLCSGCSSIFIQKFYWEGILDRDLLPFGMIYGGTCGDLIALPESSLEFGPCVPFAPFFFIDLPFSLVADTVLLPLTIGETGEMAISKTSSVRSSD